MSWVAWASVRSSTHIAMDMWTYGRTFSRIIPSSGNWYGATPGAGTTLQEYQRANGIVQTIAATQSDDAYERLMGVIAGYNGQIGIDRPWATKLTTAARNAGTNNRGYAIDVMRCFGVPARTYVWVGAFHPPGHPQAGQSEWRFAYGESEWRNPGFAVPDPANPGQVIPARFGDYRQRAVIDVNERTPCN